MPDLTEACVEEQMVGVHVTLEVKGSLPLVGLTRLAPGGRSEAIVLRVRLPGA